MMNNRYNLELVTLEKFSNLHQIWLAIESKANCSFFMSWYWVESWLKTYQPQCELIIVKLENDIVGLAIISKRKEFRHKVLPVDKVYFHQTGISTQDQIWIEYNDILATEEHYIKVCEQVFNYLQNASNCEELTFNGILKEKALLFKSLSSFNYHLAWETPSFSVNLQILKETNRNYLSTLSKNTRYQINRCQKEFNQLGTLTLSQADCTLKALEYFDNIAPFHIKRWGNIVGGSGFCNSDFIAFHQTLIKENWHNGVIHLWRMQLNNQDIGYFYNFIYNGVVYFYLSGLQEFDNSRLKPGMLGHALCIQYYLDNGYIKYDFMGGDARYKQSLANQDQSLCKLLLQKPKLKFWFENKAKKIKNLLT